MRRREKYCEKREKMVPPIRCIVRAFRMFVLLLLSVIFFAQIDVHSVSHRGRDGSLHPRVAFVSEMENTRESFSVLKRFPSTEDISEFSDSHGTALTPEELDSFIVNIMEMYHIAGVSALVVHDGRVVWTGAYGYANFRQNIQTSDSTVYMLASVSKTLTGAALLQLWEKGMFGLDDDVNDYLSFAVVNPNHPNDAITFRMLLAHTSSLRDNWDVMFSTYVPGDSPIPLDAYVQDYFVPGGIYYDAGENFNSWAPGTRWQYCNHGFVLAGYMVEAITGIPFDRYCQDSLFTPLGMDETSWFLSGLETDNIAMPYRYTQNKFVPYGHFGYADYPAGALRSSTVQLARFLIAILQKGQIDGTRILDTTTVELMTTIQYPELYPTQGLIWFQRNLGERVIWNHGGGDQGVSTMIAFCPAEQSGVVVLTNGESSGSTNTIMLKLFEFANDADGDGVVDGYDNCLYALNVDQEDGDGDGTGDVCDNCPKLYNPDQNDSDGDTTGDVCDVCTDTDGDGYGDPGYPASACDEDNCPKESNPDQAPVDRGDVDCRGGIDVLDVLAVAHHIVSSPPLAGEPFHRADCNDDGNVDILDALGMINVILGLSNCEPMTVH